eukprot:m51a1_g9424 putative adenylate guanylate cyclase (909) ;mRNA; f:383816-387197
MYPVVNMFKAKDIETGVVAVYVGTRDLCRGCTDRVLLGFSIAFAAPPVTLLLTTLGCGGLLVYSQEVAFVASGSLIAAATITPKLACSSGDSSSSSTEPVPDYALLPDELYPVLIYLCFLLVFLFFSSVPWPQCLAYVGLVFGLELAVVVFLGSVDTLMLWLLPLVLGGTVAILIAAGSTSKERRREFLGALMLERERQQVASEKAVTDSLISALFPREVAVILTEKRTTGELLGADTRSGSAALAQSFAGATVVWASVGGLGGAERFDDQLRALSRLFIAADNVAQRYDATNIRTTRNEVMFVCGVPSATPTHVRKACEFAAELQRLMAKYKELQADKSLSLRVGVATGPVVAGVIGLQKPRYDVWGEPVLMAHQIMTCAAEGEVLLAPDVAGSVQTLMECERVVADGDSGAPRNLFRLKVTGSLASPIQLTAEGAFFKARPREVKLSDVCSTPLKQREMQTVWPFLWFRDVKTELQFWQMNALRNIGSLRWVSFAMCIIFAIYIPWGLVIGTMNPERIVFKTGHVVAFAAIFVITFLRLEKTPLVIYGVLFAVVTLLSAAHVYMWDTLIWNDALMSAMLGYLLFLHISKLPFFFSSATSIAILICTLPMYTSIGYQAGSAILSISWVIAFNLIHHGLEKQTRRIFHTAQLIKKSKVDTEKEKAVYEKLLGTVLPAQVLSRLNVSAHSEKETYIANYVSDGTVMVVSVGNFAELTKTVVPIELVKLLNTLFSMFDCLAVQFDLESLKTVGGSYVVVGNILGNLPDHAIKVVFLAQAILSAFLGAEKDAAQVFLNIGIHTDSLLGGVIKTRNFVLDCWGNGIPVAEQIAAVSMKKNTIMVSSSTWDIVYNFVQGSYAQSLAQNGKLVDLYEVSLPPTSSISPSVQSLGPAVLDNQFAPVVAEDLNPSA